MMEGDIMRILGIALLSILLAASTVIAGFTLKSGVYRMNQLDAAKSDALSGRKAVAFLYSDEAYLLYTMCERQSASDGNTGRQLRCGIRRANPMRLNFPNR